MNQIKSAILNYEAKHGRSLKLRRCYNQIIGGARKRKRTSNPEPPRKRKKTKRRIVPFSMGFRNKNEFREYLRKTGDDETLKRTNAITFGGRYYPKNVLRYTKGQDIGETLLKRQAYLNPKFAVGGGAR